MLSSEPFEPSNRPYELIDEDQILMNRYYSNGQKQTQIPSSECNLESDPSIRSKHLSEFNLESEPELHRQIAEKAQAKQELVLQSLDSITIVQSQDNKPKKAARTKKKDLPFTME